MTIPIPAIIAGIAAAGTAAAQGIGTAVEANRPENRLDERGWLQRMGIDEARREAQRRAQGTMGAMRRGVQRVDLGPRAGYLVGDVGAEAAEESMLPDFRRLMAGEDLRARQKLGAAAGSMLEERGGLQAASAGRLGAAGNVMAAINKAAGGFAKKGLEGTDLEGFPLGEVLAGVSGAGSAAGQGVLGGQRRRGARRFSDQPLFGGSNYGLYGGGY